MSPSTARQTWALIRRYFITLLRSPIRSSIRILLWPGLLIGLCIYLLNNFPTVPDEKDNKYNLASYIPFINFLMTVFNVYHFAEWLVIDKATDFKSLMISMGLRRSSYQMGNSLCLIACVLPFVIVMAVISIMYILEESKASDTAIVLIFIIFVIHLAGFVFAVTSFINSTNFVPIVIVLLLLESQFHTFIVWLTKSSSESLRPVVLFIGSISPYESVRIFCDSFLVCRNCDETSYQGSLVSQPTHLILLAMTFWTMVAFAFARWFEEVCPWQTDSAVKSFFFCCKSSAKRFDISDLGETKSTRDSKFFERSIENREVGIRVQNVTKIFRNIPVVNEVDFNIYKGETTLLLGHNGAGKTTLMNMILGKMNPSSGRIKIKHSGGSSDDREGVGVCPQTSVFDENLNVKEHLELFADIKSSGLSSRALESHIRTTIDDVSLTGHMNKLPSELSGGMKRKLSLAMAFVGNSEILILDEPSSGLDPDSRVSIWNAIRRYRSDRTVLLSTQHMEEADYLGDRIAIMSGGRIICCGSSIFLNRVFGTGYKLRIECHYSAKKKVLGFVRKYFAGAQQSGGNLTDPAHGTQSQSDPMVDMVIELNDDRSKDLEMKLIKMLEEIETSSVSLGIKSHGLKSSSIEDVLLNTSKSFGQEPQETTRLTLASTNDHIEVLANPAITTDLPFYTNQWLFLRAFLLKHLNTYKKDWKSILVYRVVLTTLGALFSIRDLNSFISSPNYSNDLLWSQMIIHFVYYPTLERVTKFKTMQLTSHGNFIMYWLSQLIIDFATILVIVLGMNLFLSIAFEGVFIVPEAQVRSLISASTVLFGVSAALVAYILSTILSDYKQSVGYHVLFYSLSAFVRIIITIISAAATKDLKTLQMVFDHIFVALSPKDAFEYIFFGLASKCYVKRSSELAICVQSDSISPVVEGLLALCAQIFIYTLVIYLIENENLNLSSCCNIRNLFRRSAVSKNRQEIDDDVMEETSKAMRIINNVQQDNYSLVAADLNKSYIKGVKVVDHLSFTIKRGECFGLLGVNGAGKSTTFSMVVIELRPDSGTIWFNGHYNHNNSSEYRHKLGYDPQSNPEMSLSSTDALYLMARLRRVNEQSIPTLVRSLMDLLEMSEHASKPARNLSGGTKRKLALGMSLIGNPTLLALDEPTAGVDPMARRSIWQLLKSLRVKNRASILISSHAMEECEAICDRIAIMARGRLRCIGSFLHLRSKFARGCSIRVQFSNTVNSPINDETVAEVISKIGQRLTADIGNSVKLTDTNINSATFNITDNSVKRSTLFKIMREFRLKHPNMSYMINDSSLEDIFIALAREQQSLDQTNERS